MIYRIIIIILTAFCCNRCVFSQSGWFQLNSGTNDTLYGVHFTSNSTGYVCGKAGIMLKTTDGGLNWQPLFSSVYVTLYRIYFIDQYTGIAIGQNGTIIRTTNSGLIWGILVNTNFDGFLKGIYFLDQYTGYIAGWKGLFIKTTNAGAGWSVNVIDSARSFESVYFINSSTGFITGLSGIYYKTTDGGANWQYQNLDVSKNFHSVRFVNSLTGFIIGGYINATILMTTNSGSNWIPMLGGATGVRLYDMKFVNQDTGYICGRDGCIMKSVNSGINWFTQNTPTSQYLWSVFFISRDTGYATGGNGTILKTVSGGEPIGIKKISYIVPDKFKLYQNYPNPFNPETIIKFQCSKSANVKLTVYDILGREIAFLVDQQLKPGVYEIDFDGTKYPGGAYYYRITASEFSESRIMILVK